MIGIIGLTLSAPGCAVDPVDPTDPAPPLEIEASTAVCREVQHFDWVRAGVVTHFNVTTELGSGRQFVDERQVGGPDVQYSVSPVWSDCPHGNEIVRLKHGTTTVVGSHNCLPDGRQEFHGSDANGQRLLVPLVPFITFNCDP